MGAGMYMLIYCICIQVNDESVLSDKVICMQEFLEFVCKGMNSTCFLNVQESEALSGAVCYLLAVERLTVGWAVNLCAAMDH